MSGSISLNPKIATSGTRDKLSAGLSLGGFNPFTTIDFPGRLAAVVYTQGCAWRCRYCHNSHLWAFKDVSGPITFKEVCEFLEGRRGLLDGVVFSGGEPTAHPALGMAMTVIKEMGFQVALHTNGMFPERLREVLSFCDWVGMDVKAPFFLYEKITQIKDSGIGPKESAAIILASKIDCEFRTTVHPDLLTEEELLEMAEELARMGAKNFTLQTFSARGCFDQELKEDSLLLKPVSEAAHKVLGSLFSCYQIRQ